MKATGLAWDAFDVTLKHLLHNAYNVLVRFLNDNDLNNEHNSFYWLGTAIDGLLRYRPLDTWIPLEAMQEYITDAYCLSRFIYEYTGHDWSDFDVQREMYLCWREELFERLDARGVEPTEVIFFSPPIVHPVVPDWEMEGVLRCHNKGASV